MWDSWIGLHFHGVRAFHTTGTHELGFLGIKSRIFQIEYISSHSKCFQNVSLHLPRFCSSHVIEYCQLRVSPHQKLFRPKLSSITTASSHSPSPTTGKMGRVRTKVSFALSRQLQSWRFLGTLTLLSIDRQEVGQSHHRTLLPKTHPWLWDQQAYLRWNRNYRLEAPSQQGKLCASLGHLPPNLYQSAPIESIDKS